MGPQNLEHLSSLVGVQLEPVLGLGGWLLGLYIVGYLAGISFVGYVCLYASRVAGVVGLGGRSSAGTTQARGLIILALLNLAGLPPFIFFLAKLGLLVWLFNSAATGVWLTVGGVLFVGWVTYATHVRGQLGVRTSGALHSPLNAYLAPHLSLLLSVGSSGLLFGLPLMLEASFWL